jgi:L-ascorbate 6-phosphate lactonase
MGYQQSLNTVNEIKTTAQLPAGSVALWWLGQAGFVVRSATMTILIDPFLTQIEGRTVAPPFAPEDCPPVDLILYTHEHLDHLDVPALKILAKNSGHPRIIAPLPILDQLLRAGVDQERLQGVQPGEELQIGEAKIYPLASFHGLTFPPVVYSFGKEISDGLYRYLGYVVELNGVRLYHAGDTLIFDGLIEQLKGFNLDLALLPINGRSYFREQQNLIGNLDEREAADLAAAAGIKAVIPAHYEIFATNVGRPGFFVDYILEHHPELTCYVPSHGRRLVYVK